MLRHPEPVVPLRHQLHGTVHRQPVAVEPAYPRPTAKTFKYQLGRDTLWRQGAAQLGVVNDCFSYRLLMAPSRFPETASLL